MYLKKLKISGFKSFADKLEIEFVKGVTSIVGPNGCGKSNVSDSIRWVLGEHNPRRLRGNQMQDMIFNGTANRPAAGMAEVSILFDNTDNLLPIAYREVEVTRRLYRNGDSEYLINQTKCRLKDVTDLFLDSGIGTNCYSIMEQGRVDMIVNAKPAERREIIEEAAGVSRYLNRKVEAMRKLDRTQQDLTRIDDILGELQRRRRSLERQAKQAELAKKYRGELNVAEYILHQRSGKKLYDDLKSIGSKLNGLTAQVQVLDGELRTVRQRKTSLNEKLQEQDEANRKQRDAYASSSARLEQMDRHLQHLVAQEKEYTQLQTRLQSESEADRKRMEEERERVETANKHVAALEEATKQIEETIAALNGEMERINQELESIESEGAEKQKIFLNVEHNITELKNQQRLWERDREHIEKRLQQVTQEREQLSAEIQSHQDAIQSLAEEKTAVEQDVTASREKLDDLNRRYQEQTTREGQLKHQLNECEREWQRAHSRLESLRALQANLEGFDEGVRYLLRGDQKPLSDLLCTVAERIQVQPGYERAVEAALALKLQAVIAENDEAVRRAIERLRDEKKGRVAFLSLAMSEGAHDAVATDAVSHLPSVTQYIECDESFRPVVQRLLRHAYLVESLPEALQLQPQLQSGIKLVTKDGDVVEGDGAVTGGYSKGSQILDRTTEISQLDRRVEELSVERNRLEKETAEVHEHIVAMGKERDETKQRLLEQKNRLNALADSLQTKQNLLQRQTQTVNALQGEQSNLSKELETGAGQTASRSEQLGQLQQQLQALESEIQSWQGKLEEIRAARKQKSDEIAEHRMTRLEKQKDRERWAADVETFSRHIRELEHGIEEKLYLCKQQEERRQDTFKGIEETRQSIEQLKTERDRLWDEVQKCEAVNQEMRSDIQKVGRDENELMEKLDTVRNEQHQNEQEQMRLKVEEEYWNKKMAETFENLPNREEIERDERTNEELEEKVAFYRRRLEQLGMVNELAIEEYEEVKDRCGFLEHQQKDLEKSKADLIATTKELHSTTVDLFLETFKTVQENFSRTFRRIFNGGRAEIRLLEGDPMEAGIEIEVQPPGKKLQSITLLSGGEKAMVAVSLLFAIYEIKPSPFCFLDEMDAPLDDVSIGRFTSLLEGFLDKSQFIMITHNKKTMQVADAIYGVTMPEEGASTIYSMKFQGKDVADVTVNHNGANSNGNHRNGNHKNGKHKAPGASVENQTDDDAVNTETVHEPEAEPAGATA